MVGSTSDEFASRRSAMVRDQIAGRGLSDERVLEAMGSVPRERFVPAELAPYAYQDRPLPIEEGQTISQPLIVAEMAAAAELTPDSRVLEVGTGSGYGAAVLGRIAAQVFTIERHEELAEQARRRLHELGYENVHVTSGDGTLGWPEHAPYDAIVVTADAPSVPPALLEQLGDGGRLIIPVGPDSDAQKLLRIRRHDDQIVEENLGGVRFVPLIGEQGWRPPPER